MNRFVVILILLFVPSPVYTSVIRVPRDHPSIQAAIDAATKGDTVLVAAGTYNENIDFIGKAVRVTSEQGPAATLIDGGQKNCVVIFQSGEGSGSILEGFTVTNGLGQYGSYYTGGVLCRNASPHIRNNVITDNTEEGVYCQNSSAYIMGNVIQGSHGTGVILDSSQAVLLNNTISQNEDTMYGGGVYCAGTPSPRIVYNTICNNSAPYGAGIYCYWNTAPMIYGNLIKDNQGKSGGGIGCEFEAAPFIANNIIAGNTAVIGGGIYLSCLSWEIDVFSNVLTGNRASDSGGGLWIDSVYYVRITNNTFFKNGAGSRGGGAFFGSYCMPDVKNAIFWMDKAPQGPEIAVGCSGTADISWSDLEGGRIAVYLESGAVVNWGPNMIDADPLFADSDRADLHILYTSPCRNAGANGAAGCVDFDYEGDPRIAHGKADMGADEFYTHLYCIGDPAHRKTVEVKVTDLPGTTPVVLWVGSGVIDPPHATIWGDWHLELPVLSTLILGTIPSSGVEVLTVFIPQGFPQKDVPFQVMSGTNLTNLCILPLQ